MIRLLFRALGLALLLAALLAVITDAARSIAASNLWFTQIGPAWLAASPSSLARVEEFVKVRIEPTAGSWVWDPLITWLLTLPASAVFAVLGFLFLLMGAPRRRRVYA